MIDSGLVGSLWEGTTRAEDAQGSPTQSRISSSMLVYEDVPLNRISHPNPDSVVDGASAGAMSFKPPDKLDHAVDTKALVIVNLVNDN